MSTIASGAGGWHVSDARWERERAKWPIPPAHDTTLGLACVTTGRLRVRVRVLGLGTVDKLRGISR